MKYSNYLLGASGLLLCFSACQERRPSPDRDGAAGSVAQAVQACDATCTQILQPASFRKLDGNVTPVAPGARVCLAAGHIDYLRLENLHGTAAAPIEVINCGGQATLGYVSNSTAVRGFVVTGSSHLKITGTGDPNEKYGIKIDGAVSQGLDLSGKSTDIEVAFLEISNTYFAGIMAKTDPTCDGSANRGTFVQYNTVIHDNYIHDTGGEGLYIGFSFYYNGRTSADCPGLVLYPHDLVGVRIYRNRLENTHADGIQVGCAVADVEVHDNSVEGYGIAPFESNQNSAVQIGEGTTGKWYNNYLCASGDADSGLGFSVIGQGDISIFNNVMVDPSGGVYINAKVPAGSSVAIQNNTVVRPKQYVLKTPNDDAPILFRNNLVVTDPGVPPIVLDKPNIPITQDHNLIVTDINIPGFVDPPNGDYHLTPASPARDAGADASAYFGFDFDDDPRDDGIFDIGADEYRTSALDCPVVLTQDFSGSSALSNYINATAPSTGQFNDISAETTGGTWSISGGRLVIVRAGSNSATDNGAGLTRFTDFGCTPTVLHVAFSLAVSSWTTSPFQSNAFCLDIGNFTSVFRYVSAGQLSNVFSSLCVKGQGASSFAFTAAGGESSSFPTNGTPFAVSYFLNRSGALKTYKGLDNATHTLGVNSVAVWAGTALLFDNVPASNGSTSALTDLRMRWGTPENATWSVDNIVVRSDLPQP